MYESVIVSPALTWGGNKVVCSVSQARTGRGVGIWAALLLSSLVCMRMRHPLRKLRVWFDVSVGFAGFETLLGEHRYVVTHS